jgi:hypothetical protein
MWRAIVATVSVAVCAVAASNSATAQHWRIPDGYDNATPRYYDYRAPRAYYYDDAPAALRLDRPLVIAPPPLPPPVAVAPPPARPAPLYAPTGATLPPAAYPPPPYGYAAPPPPAYGYAAPPPPYPAAVARPICGVYRFWSGDRCVDARGY